MNSQQVSDLKLLYNAVYDENLREKADEYNHMVRDEDIVEVATEYFYNYGLNESGVNILIEKVGLENFVEFVCGLSEDLIFLNEARKTSKAKRQEGSLASRQRAKLEAQRAAKERTETERKAPESKGADTEAKSEQPKQKPKKDGISRAVSGALDTFKRGMQNHNTAVEKTGETLRNIAGRLGGVAREVGGGASGAARLAVHIASKGLKEEFEYWVNSLVEEGYDLSDYTWDEMAEIYMTELHKGKHGQSDEEHMDSRSDAAKRISGDSQHSGASWSHRSYKGVGKPAKPGERQEHQGRMTDADRNELAIRKADLKAGKVRKVGGEKGLPESYDHFDYLLEYLVAEGYADTNENALKIMANMSEEWRESIIDEGLFGSGGVSASDARNRLNQLKGPNLKGPQSVKGDTTLPTPNPLMPLASKSKSNTSQTA